MCRLLGVSTSGYYAWTRRPLCPRKREDAGLRELIIAIHQRSRGNYGAPRIWDELRYDHNIRCSGKRVWRLMRQLGIKGTHRRRYRKTTARDASLPVAPDLMNRDFTASRPDEKYVGDITYIRTWEGWLYLATVIDLASRRVVGWAMAEHMRAELVCDALRMAINARHPAPGAMFHSDRGTQYTSKEFNDLLAEHEMIQSLSRPRQCWDNAVAESFFASLKLECIYRQALPTRAHARRAVFDYIEVFFNRQRLHSSLGYCTPATYENKIRNTNTTHAA